MSLVCNYMDDEKRRDDALMRAMLHGLGCGAGAGKVVSGSSNFPSRTTGPGETKK